MRTAIFSLLILVLILSALRAWVSSRHKIEAEKLQTPLYAEIEGENNENAVLFLHGIGGSGRYWKFLIDPLSKNHQVITVDLLGFGRSPWPEVEYTVDQHLDALEKTLEVLKVPRKISIVGHSMGALLALDFAKRRPERINKILLISIPYVKTHSEKEKLRIKNDIMKSSMGVPAIFSHLLCLLHEAFGTWILPLFKPFMRELPEHVKNDVILHTWRSFNKSLENVILGQDLGELFESVKGHPVLLIQGDKDVHAVAIEMQSLTQKHAIPMKVFEGSHNFILKEDAAVNSTVIQFLE